MEAHTMLAALTHRRMIDPRFLAKRPNPFVIERVSVPPATPALTPQGPAICAGADMGREFKS